MRIVDKTNYNDYLLANGVDSNWKKRDFVTEVEKYMDSTIYKVFLVSGLRGTGKSIDVLQAMRDRDVVYIWRIFISGMREYIRSKMEMVVPDVF